MEHAAEDPSHVGVEDGGARAVGERAHGTGRVPADSLHGAQGLVVGREPAAVPRDRLARDAVKVHRADVVAEGVPRPRDVGDVGCRQRLERGVAPEELVVLRDHAVHLGLLEHDLRDQDVIGVARPPPGQVPLVAPVPPQQALAEAPERPGVRVRASRSPARGFCPRADYIEPAARQRPHHRDPTRAGPGGRPAADARGPYSLGAVVSER